MFSNGGVWRTERFDPAADARRKKQPVCRQLWTTGRWYPRVGVYYLGSDSGGASLRYGLRSQYPRLSERGDLLPRLRRIQLPPPDHHHLSGQRNHAPRALHQDRCGRDHPFRHHLPESALAQQLVPGSQGEQRRAHPHRGRDADQPHQRQGTVAVTVERIEWTEHGCAGIWSPHQQSREWKAHLREGHCCCCLLVDEAQTCGSGIRNLAAVHSIPPH